MPPLHPFMKVYHVFMKKKENPQSLTKTEQRYMDLLMKGKPVNLWDLLGEKETNNTANLVSVNIRNLRKKLPAKYQIISIKGFGYRLIPSEV